jgi:hypothetical protein
MANFTDETQRKTAFFHALGYVLTKKVNDPYNESYKSSHNIRTNEVWVDSVGFSAEYTDAVSEASNNSAVTRIGNTASGTASLALLYPLKNSDRQTWFLDTGSPSWQSNGFVPSSGFVRPLISPVDVPNSESAPSNGYTFQLWDAITNQVVPPLNGKWEVDYYGGFIKFESGSTPGDSGNGAVTQLDASALITAGGATNSAAATAYLQGNGPRAIAFQYTGQYLDAYLTTISNGSGGSGGGSEEWQSSVNGYLINVGIGATVNGLTGPNEQISYLNDEYEKYYIYTTSDVTGNTWSLSTNTYYRYDTGSFSSYVLDDTDTDASNVDRFLLVETPLNLDTILLSSTGSVTELGNNTVLADRIIEITSTASTGLTYAAWQVTEPRLGMVTTLDNKSSNLVRYVGSSWSEYQYESTFKVSSQKWIQAQTTTADYDIAMGETLQYEPSGSKGVDVLINGVEVPNSVYVFGNPSATSSLTLLAEGTNTVDVPVAQTPTTGQYLVLDNGNDYFRQVTATSSATGTISRVTYSGNNVSGINNLYLFDIATRSGNVGKQGDYLLWIGSSWYELTQDTPADYITLEYTTTNSNAIK